MKRIVFACILCLAIAACSKTTPTAPVADSDKTATPTAPAPVEAAAGLFPARDWEMKYIFDDGSKEAHEWWVRTPERVVAATAQGVYAVWQIRPDGIYRRDPLGGEGAAWLRYLPSALQDNLVWQQQSGDATVRFWLRQLSTCVGFGPDEYLYESKEWRRCWELRIHNRDQVQRFDFVPGKGVVAADVLAPAKPGASFHKVSDTFEPLREAPPGKMADWLAAAGASPVSASQAPPVQASTPAAFTAAVQASLQPRLSSVALDSGTPTWMIGALDAYTPDPLLVLLDPGGEAWYRLGGGCQHRLLLQIMPVLLQECKVAPDFGDPGVQTYRVEAWYRTGSQLQRYYVPAEGRAIS